MYSIGQRVMINESGFKAYDEDDSNPRDTIGTVSFLAADGWFEVKWDNGNSYEPGTLDVVGE